MDKIFEAYKECLTEKKTETRELERGWVITSFHHEKGNYEDTSKSEQDENIKSIIKDINSDIRNNITNLKGWKIDKYEIKGQPTKTVPKSGHKGKMLKITLKK